MVIQGADSQINTGNAAILATACSREIAGTPTSDPPCWGRGARFQPAHSLDEKSFRNLCDRQGRKWVGTREKSGRITRTPNKARGEIRC